MTMMKMMKRGRRTMHPSIGVTTSYGEAEKIRNGQLILPHSAQRKDPSYRMAEEGCKIWLDQPASQPATHPATQPPSHPPTFGNMDWWSGISQQPLIGSYSNFKLKLRWPKYILSKVNKIVQIILVLFWCCFQWEVVFIQSIWTLCFGHLSLSLYNIVWSSKLKFKIWVWSNKQLLR